MIDSHAHLNFHDLKDSIDSVIQRAKNSGVSKIVSICTKFDDLKEIKDIVNLYKDYVYYSVGIHPDHAEEELLKYGDEKILDIIVSEKQAIGIGECGFDFKDGDMNKNIQERVFQLHIDASISENKPLIVHTRDAEHDTKRILLDNKKLQKVLFHCYSGSIDFVKFALDYGAYISFSGIVSFKNAKSLHEVAKFVPLDRILIETDAPFLAPVPFRGKVNEPSYVIHIAECLANLKGVEVDEIINATTKNFKKLFLNVDNSCSL